MEFYKIPKNHFFKLKWCSTSQNEVYAVIYLLLPVIFAVFLILGKDRYRRKKRQWVCRKIQLRGKVTRTSVRVSKVSSLNQQILLFSNISFRTSFLMLNLLHRILNTTFYQNLKENFWQKKICICKISRHRRAADWYLLSNMLAVVLISIL